MRQILHCQIQFLREGISRWRYEYTHAIRDGQHGDRVYRNNVAALAASQAEGVVQCPPGSIGAINADYEGTETIACGNGPSHRTYLPLRRIRTRVCDAHDPPPSLRAKGRAYFHKGIHMQLASVARPYAELCNPTSLAENVGLGSLC